MRRHPRVTKFAGLPLTAGAMFALVAALAACGGGSPAVASQPAVASPPAAASSSAASVATTVEVTLQEFAVVPSLASVPAGTVSFVVKNVGPDDIHEVVVIKSDLAVESLPVDKDGKAIEDAPGVTAIGESGDVAVAETKQVDFELTPGNYLLICNILQKEPDGTLESHYKVGMRTAFVVTGS